MPYPAQAEINISMTTFASSIANTVHSLVKHIIDLTYWQQDTPMSDTKHPLFKVSNKTRVRKTEARILDYVTSWAEIFHSTHS